MRETKPKRSELRRERDEATARSVRAERRARSAESELADTKVLLKLASELAEDRLRGARVYVRALRSLLNHKGLDLDARAIVRGALDHREGVPGATETS